jgi:hypothetical protein
VIIAIAVLGAVLLLSFGFNFYLIRVMQAERRYLMNYAMADDAFQLMGMEKVMTAPKPSAQPPQPQAPRYPEGM